MAYEVTWIEHFGGRTTRWSVMVAMMLFTAPAIAQRQGPPAPVPARAESGYVPATGDVTHAIDRAEQAGRLSRSDRNRARDENGVTDALADRFASDGRVTDDERAEISTRNAVAQSILNAPATRSRGR